LPRNPAGSKHGVHSKIENRNPKEARKLKSEMDFPPLWKSEVDPETGVELRYARSAGFPACGFWRLSSSHSAKTVANNWRKPASFCAWSICGFGLAAPTQRLEPRSSAKTKARDFGMVERCKCAVGTSSASGDPGLLVSSNPGLDVPIPSGLSGLLNDGGVQLNERTERRSATGFGRPVRKWWAAFKAGHPIPIPNGDTASEKRSWGRGSNAFWF